MHATIIIMIDSRPPHSFFLSFGVPTQHSMASRSWFDERSADATWVNSWAPLAAMCCSFGEHTRA
ncbi:unnamed protein product [Periconia digitata]|uniref:Uncharacterized protein n=1 Tax=Periconia digitata TaxID=1303443 RepID=A0A9W4UQ21_9PLEO|nr:unnamed protein product [Periconia digitata]